MRRVADPRPKLGSVPIESIRIDALSRDDIPAILKGLQLIWCDADKREEVFALLETHVRPGTDRSVDGPGWTCGGSLFWAFSSRVSGATSTGCRNLPTSTGRCARCWATATTALTASATGGV